MEDGEGRRKGEQSEVLITAEAMMPPAASQLRE